jgi:WD40 repeat protein/DNA-binding SARP family transcriptional activator
MSEVLRLILFGSPQIWADDRPLTGFATNKAQALLFYLAVAPHTPHSRDALATLLWGEMSDLQAKQNLRAVLPNLRRLVGDHLRIDHQTIAFDPTVPYWLDVEMFRRGLTSGQVDADSTALQATVALYQGEFLEGFYVRDAPLFEMWALQQREQLHVLVVDALSRLVSAYTQHDDHAAALAANRRLLLLEPWSEPVHRQQMLLLARTGDRAAALAQYESCRRILASEFGIEPLPETLALYEQIRAGVKGRPDDQEPERPGDQGQEARHQAPLPLSVAGHNLPPRTKLYGRQAELADLLNWVRAEGRRVVGIFGIGGQGKTALAAALVHTLAQSAPLPGGPQIAGGVDAAPVQSAVGTGQGGFGRIIWQSLLNAPPLAEVLQEWFYVLSDQTVTSLPASLDRQFAQLLAYLRSQRCLLILDNLESILQSGENSGRFRPGYESYGQLMRHLAAGEHRSCLLLTSRERPLDLTHLEEETPGVRSLILAGLSTEAGRQLLRSCGLNDDRGDLDELVQHYSGNPLALKLSAETVHEVFDGDLAAFLQAETLVFDDIRHVLDQQFARLTPLERDLMLWLALLREPVPFPVLRDLLAQPPAPRLALEAVSSLQRRSLIEKSDAGFGLQNVVLEYATDRLIENVSRELLVTPSSSHPAILSHLNSYPLMLAQVKEYVRASQTRLLLQPVGERLVSHLGKTGAEQQLRRLLAQARTTPPLPGYAAANLLHLLLHLGADLRGDDFSQLYLRQACLRGVSLPQTSFAGAQLIDSVFTEPFGLIYSVAFSPDGQYVAAATSEGAIYLWRTGDQQLAQVIQAHHHAIRQVAIAQQPPAEDDGGLMLASASDDKCAGFWALTAQGQVRRHVNLSHAQQEALVAVGLHPDGQRVTAVDIDGHVFVWHIGAHQEPQLAHHFATAFTRIRLVAFSRDGQTVVIGHRDGAVRFWQAATGEARLRLAGMTGLIFTLALSRDGQLLATGGREGRLSLWRLPTGELEQVIETKAGAIRALAFSPDGRFLASGHEDLAVRLWAIDAQGRPRLQRTLLGHTQTIWSVAFGPSPAARPETSSATRRDSSREPTRQLLVTGSSDQTVRVWDVETGHTLYMLRGQPRVLAAHTIRQLPSTPPDNPPGMRQAPEWLLAAAGYDQLVHLWQGQGNAVAGTHRVLHGARGPLYAVAISPDGRHVVAGGYDPTIYLWDRASGRLRQTLHGHTNCIYALAFHPDGRLLASGSGDGALRLWRLPEVEDGPGRLADVASSAQRVAVLQADLDVVHDLAFSPDGRILARGGSDRSLRLWDMTQPHYPELVDERRLVQDASEEDIFGVAFSPDGSKVACSGNHLVHIVDLASGKAPLILRRHAAWIAGVAFSPDGEILASGSADCTVCLWEVASGALRAVLRGHREIVYRVAFTPDGTAVVSSSFDGTLKFWDTQTGDCISTLMVEGPYAGMNITGVTGLTEAQKAALKVLGAVEMHSGSDLTGTVI